MINFEYQNPTKILFGKGQLENGLVKEILKFGKKVLLVYGGQSLIKSGHLDKIHQLLDDAGITYIDYGDVRVPSLEKLYQGIEQAKKYHCELIIGIGGGCCIDMAKSIAVGCANDVDIWDVLTGQVPYDTLNVLPIGAIVTIAGSGSEMDGNSEIDNLLTKQHGSIGSFQKTYPSFAILDPELTYSAPFSITAYHGVTILVQAMEQYLSTTKNTPIQDGFIETICKTVMDALMVLKDDLTNENARGQLLWASALTTNRILGRGKAAAWMGGPLGGILEDTFHLTYSQGIAITWPKYLLVSYRDYLPLLKRFSINVMQVDPKNKTDEEITQEGMIKFQSFFDEIGIAHSMKDLGIHGSLKVLMEVQNAIERVAKRKIISKEDLIKIINLSIGE